MLILFLGVLTGLAGCSSQKKLETTPPFTVGSATYEPWMAGSGESAAGHKVKIILTEMSEDEVALQNIYFRGQMAKVILELEHQGIMATARFEDLKPDINMHADPQLEVGNQPPKIRESKGAVFPFDIKDDEAILSYLESDKVKYVRVARVMAIPARNNPGRPQN